MGTYFLIASLTVYLMRPSMWVQLSSRRARTNDAKDAPSLGLKKNWLHKLRNLWHSFTEEGGPCEFNTSVT
ncbi:MAG: hypothetical protein ACPL3S_01545, partial [Halothiobacillaceae bacterium]